jgi:hypothetical protein
LLISPGSVLLVKAAVAAAVTAVVEAVVAVGHVVDLHTVVVAAVAAATVEVEVARPCRRSYKRELN